MKFFKKFVSFKAYHPMYVENFTSFLVVYGIAQGIVKKYNDFEVIIYDI